jgi:hypothetical protein
VKCKFCGYQSANKQFMVIHIRNNHRGRVESLPTTRRYSAVDLHNDDLIESLALASLLTFIEPEPSYSGGGGSFDGGGASDSYDSGSSSSSSYSSSDSGSSYSSSDSGSSYSSSDSGSSGGSDY